MIESYRKMRKAIDVIPKIPLLIILSATIDLKIYFSKNFTLNNDSQI